MTFLCVWELIALFAFRLYMFCLFVCFNFLGVLIVDVGSASLSADLPSCISVEPFALSAVCCGHSSLLSRSHGRGVYFGNWDLVPLVRMFLQSPGPTWVSQNKNWRSPICWPLPLIRQHVEPGLFAGFLLRTFFFPKRWKSNSCFQQNWNIFIKSRVTVRFYKVFRMNIRDCVALWI